MPEKNNKEHEWSMECKVCHAHNPRHMMVRWILGLLILFLVFWVGLKIGEFKGYFENYNGDGYGAMSRHGMLHPGGYGYPMMGDWPTTAPATVPNTNSITTTPKK